MGVLGRLLFIALLASVVWGQDSNSQAWHTSDIIEVKFNKNATKLISYSAGDGWLFLWDVATGDLIWRNKTGFIQKGDEYYTLTSLAFSPDERFIASGSGNGTVALWNATTGHLIWRSDVHSSHVTVVEFTPDGKSVVSAATPEGGEDEVKILRVENGAVFAKLEGRPCTVIAISFQGNDTLRTGNLDGAVANWDLTSGKAKEKGSQLGCKLRRTYEWETAFSPDLRLATKRTGEKEVTLTDTAQNRTIKTLEAEDYRIYSRISSDGTKLIVSGYGGFTVYDLAKGTSRKIDEFSRTGSTIDLSLDGRFFAEGGSYGNAAIKVTNLETGHARLIGEKSKQQKPAPLVPSALETRLLAERRQKQAEIAIENARRDARAATETAAMKGQVVILFDHYGDMSDPGEKRLMESDEPKESKAVRSPETANAIWLRLHNNSALPIEIPTRSMYPPNPKCFVVLTSGKKVPGLCDAREISVWHGLEDKKGKAIQYGFDFGSSAVLLPNTSVVFPIPRNLLEDGKAIRFSYTFQNDTIDGKVGDYGDPIVVRFAEKDLPAVK